MNNHNHYNTTNKERKVFLIAMVAVIVVVTVALCVSCKGEDSLVKCWVLCKPGSQVNIRRTPSKKGQEVGFLEVGDWFLTDGSSKNGFIRAYGVGDGGGWIFCGNVVEEEPVPVFEQYVCCARTRVACRKWICGPQTSLPWLCNGSNVQVFYKTSEWSITARGYIRSEWLEVDPR